VSTRKTEALLFWTGLACVGTAYELWAVRSHHDAHTLSVYTRVLFRTDTKPGRVAFTLAWGGLATWFAHHILNEGNPHAE
jgi:hypothetical protein